MIRPGFTTVWRIASMGVREVLLVRVGNDKAQVCSKMGVGWAQKPMTVHPADLFVTRSEAQAEYHQRRRAAKAADPRCDLNFTTPLKEPR